MEDERVISEEDREKISDEDADDVAYTAYQPAKLPYGRPHPDPVVENSSLGAVQPPDVTCTYFSNKNMNFMFVLLLCWCCVMRYAHMYPSFLRMKCRRCNACMHMVFCLLCLW